MDQEANPKLNERETPDPEHADTGRHPTRRQVLKYGLYGAAGLSAAGAAAGYVMMRARSVTTAVNPLAALSSLASPTSESVVFEKDAPQGKLWQQWKKHGWVKEARHYLKLGGNVQCKLCPNECVLEPEDRSHCRDRVYKEGKLYTMAYGNPCAFHVDPIEKKPLFHFLPTTGVFSIATCGCGFRCLNCQNWDISQRKPEEAKDPRGEPLRLNPEHLDTLGRSDIDRLSMFPDDVVALAEHFDCPSIAYTYSEPTVWYEYMIDTAKRARQKQIKNVWVTCGFIQEEPLVELCKYIDAANVDLKSFDATIYERLNSGKLEPILSTLKTLRREGVWFEITNLVVPTYTDRPEMIRRMCDWLVANLGPDYPLHFSRFHPAHKLTHLPPTPVDTLSEAREIARKAGLHYVYVGNCREVADAETTFCPGCKRPVIKRSIYSVGRIDLDGGKCSSCGTEIAGVWS